MEDTFAQPHDPGFASPLEESAVAAEIERIKNDPRRRAIMDLENETLYAARTVAIAQATMKRNARLRRKIERDLYEDYTQPVVRSFVPDTTRPAFPTLGVAVAVLLIAAGAAVLIIPSRLTAKPAHAAETAATTTAEVIVPNIPLAQPKEEKLELPTVARNTTNLPTKAQKDATAAVCRKVAENRRAHYEADNISPELFTSTCYYDLLAMAWAESRFDCTVVGDQGRSRGCFQIQTKLHGVSVEHAENYAWAAEWTLDRMVRDIDYPRLRTAALARHNGSGDAAAAYAASVKAQAAAYERMGL